MPKAGERNLPTYLTYPIAGLGAGIHWQPNELALWKKPSHARLFRRTNAGRQSDTAGWLLPVLEGRNGAVHFSKAMEPIL
jgi:hypothetical protein